MRSNNEHPRAISQEMPQPSITRIGFTVTYIKFQPHLRGGGFQMGTDHGRTIEIDAPAAWWPTTATGFVVNFWLTHSARNITWDIFEFPPWNDADARAEICRVREKLGTQVLRLFMPVLFWHRPLHSRKKTYTLPELTFAKKGNFPKVGAKSRKRGNFFSQYIYGSAEGTWKNMSRSRQSDLVRRQSDLISRQSALISLGASM